MSYFPQHDNYPRDNWRKDEAPQKHDDSDGNRILWNHIQQNAPSHQIYRAQNEPSFTTKLVLASVEANPGSGPGNCADDGCCKNTRYNGAVSRTEDYVRDNEP